MDDPLEERLRDHAKAFDSLLSLIPAKLYYGEDTSDQWKRKKQSKEQKRNAKLAKLDPDSAKSAKDIMVERAQKRKREEEDADVSGDQDVRLERPGEGLRRPEKKQKKQNLSKESIDNPSATTNTDETEALGEKNDRSGKSAAQRRAEKSATKRENLKAKKQERKVERKVARKERKERLREKNAAQTASLSLTGPASNPSSDPNEEDDGDEHSAGEDDAHHAEDNNDVTSAMHSMDDNEQRSKDHPITDSPTSAPGSPTFDEPAHHSGSSSISSILPPPPKPDAEKGKKKKKKKGETGANPSSSSLQDPKHHVSTPSSDELRERLRKRLEEMRTARGADGLDGKPAKNRQELLESRRRKEEQRKAHKKELRRKAKEEEQRKADEELSRRFSPNSGSLFGSPRSPVPEPSSSSSSPPGNNNFSYGRVAFADGDHADPAAMTAQGKHRQPRKGPQDPLGTLKAAEAKEARLADYDEAKRADIESKDMWLNAKRRAHGERVRDDTSLLKKALKRKESVKRKSEREWNERIDGVQRGKDLRQAKREDNLRKRKEEKIHHDGGKKGKGSGGRGGKSKNKKIKSRPGFEGSFKARVGGKK